jgi:hypothetical protein
MLFPGTRGLVYRQPTSGRHVALILQVSTQKGGDGLSGALGDSSTASQHPAATWLSSCRYLHKRGVMLFAGTRGLVYRQPISGRHVALILQVSTQNGGYALPRHQGTRLLPANLRTQRGSHPSGIYTNDDVYRCGKFQRGSVWLPSLSGCAQQGAVGVRGCVATNGNQYSACWTTWRDSTMFPTGCRPRSSGIK